jgi:hypothetical protein
MHMIPSIESTIETQMHKPEAAVVSWCVYCSADNRSTLKVSKIHLLAGKLEPPLRYSIAIASSSKDRAENRLPPNLFIVTIEFYLPEKIFDPRATVDGTRFSNNPDVLYENYCFIQGAKSEERQNLFD